VAIAQQAARPVGRPRCMETHKAILSAAADLLEHTPYRDISVERIAASAGVGKQTIYRWYDSKADLLLDAFLTRYTEAMPPVVVGGEPLANFRAYLHHLAIYLPSPVMEGAYRALFAEAQFERTFRQRFSEIVLKRRQDIARAFVISAIHKKQIREDVDPDLIVDMILTPILFKFLSTVSPPDQSYVDRVMDTVLAGVALKAESKRELTQV
jgi:AcrR family transcriptional regulator